MFALRDGSLQFIVLTHLVARLQQGGAEEFIQSGINLEQIERLRVLQACDLKRLAEFPLSMVKLALDGGSLTSGLRHLAVIKDVQFLEDYFIRHGAPARMMKMLFSMAYKTTCARRRSLGQKPLYGRPVLPSHAVRDWISQFWAAHGTLDRRSRYYQLHQAFPAYRFDTLHCVIIEYDRMKP